MHSTSALPIVIIGAGPVGLAAAAHLAARGLPWVGLEAGPAVGAAIREWSHVRLFSPWAYNLDPTAESLLRASGWVPPDASAYPTGGDLVTRYLEPLSRLPALAPFLHLNARVTGVARLGRDKLKSDPARAQAPFRIRWVTPRGEEEMLARAVIDASGTWQAPNPLGAEGLPARGEAACSAAIRRGLPDVLQRERGRYAGRRVLVAGSGHSAFNVLVDLATLAEAEPATTITWVVRRPSLERVLGGGELDQLTARGALGATVQRLLETGRFKLHLGFRPEQVESRAEGLYVRSGENWAGPVDELVVATGFRPDFSFLTEVQLQLDPAVETTPALAPLIDPNLHSCGTVRPHGHAELSHPEPGFYIVGMKSYGRAPTFLLRTGYEQVRSIVAALAGDLEAANRVELVLPETGVCSGDRDLAATTCCGAARAPEPEPASAATCCGGAPRQDAGACCREDEEAKAAGGSGCGCGSAADDPVAAVGADRRG